MSERAKNWTIISIVLLAMLAVTVIATVPMIAHTLDIINEYWGW